MQTIQEMNAASIPRVAARLNLFDKDGGFMGGISVADARRAIERYQKNDTLLLIKPEFALISPDQARSNKTKKPR